MTRSNQAGRRGMRWRCGRTIVHSVRERACQEQLAAASWRIHVLLLHEVEGIVHAYQTCLEAAAPAQEDYNTFSVACRLTTHTGEKKNHALLASVLDRSVDLLSSTKAELMDQNNIDSKHLLFSICRVLTEHDLRRSTSHNDQARRRDRMNPPVI